MKRPIILGLLSVLSVLALALAAGPASGAVTPLQPAANERVTSTRPMFEWSVPENETAQLSARILAEQNIALVPVAALDSFTADLRQQLR